MKEEPTEEPSESSDDLQQPPRHARVTIEFWGAAVQCWVAWWYRCLIREWRPLDEMERVAPPPKVEEESWRAGRRDGGKERGEGEGERGGRFFPLNPQEHQLLFRPDPALVRFPTIITADAGPELSSDEQRGLSRIARRHLRRLRMMMTQSEARAELYHRTLLLRSVRQEIIDGIHRLHVSLAEQHRPGLEARGQRTRPPRGGG